MQCCWRLQLLLKHPAQWWHLLLLLLGCQSPLRTAHLQLLLEVAGGFGCCLPPPLLLLLPAQGVKTTVKFDQTRADQACPAEQQVPMRAPTHAAAAAAAVGPAAAVAAGTAPAASFLCYLSTLLHSNPLEPYHP
jgi:hypothetical protein